MRSRLWMIIALSSLLSAQMAWGLDVSASLEVGGTSSITVEPGDTFTVDVMLAADQNMVSAQGQINGDGAYFSAVSRTFDATNGWDDSDAGALGFTAGALPTGDIGTLALDVHGGALAGKFVSVEIAVDAAAPAGAYTLELANLTVGDLNFDAANVTGITNLTVNVASPATPPVITAAVSRKVHGSNSFDVNIKTSAAVEPRAGGPTQLVVTFDKAIALLGTGTDVTVSSGTVSGLVVDGSTLTVNMSGATDRAPMTIAFPGVADAAGPTAASACTGTLCVGVLVGDAGCTGGNTPDGTVNIYDLICIKNAFDRAATASNFLNDVSSSANDAPDGTINIYDIIAVKNHFDRVISANCP